MGKAKVVRLSVWDGIGSQMAQSYGVRGVPTFLIFDGQGQVAARYVGRLEKAEVRQQINELNNGE